MKLQSSKVFIRLHGYMLEPPFRVLLDYFRLGDLLSLMKKLKTSDKTLSMLQIMSVVEQLVLGLVAMVTFEAWNRFSYHMFTIGQLPYG